MRMLGSKCTARGLILMRELEVHHLLQRSLRRSTIGDVVEYCYHRRSEVYSLPFCVSMPKGERVQGFVVSCVECVSSYLPLLSLLELFHLLWFVSLL